MKWIVKWDKKANGYRLPTEAEWEYACRAGTTTAYKNGENISDSIGWYRDNSSNKTTIVGQKSANAWGLYDMHGNVWEWCWDWLGSYGSRAYTDPTGDTSSSSRIIRGGSWSDTAGYLRSAYRHGNNPYYGASLIGFRVARNGQ
jgi:formylglycine-generating enzyme required for sulfatase activity